MIRIVNGNRFEVETLLNVPPISCLMQVSVRRSTASLPEVRIQNQETREQDANCIKDFDDFVEKVDSQIDGFHFIENESVSMTDAIESKVILFFKFSNVQSPFGFLHLDCAKRRN